MSKMGIVRVSLLLTLLLTAGLYSLWRIECVRASYSSIKVEKVPDGEENSARKNSVSALLEQSNQFQSWAVLVLGGVAALLVTTKVHRSPFYEWAYLPMGPGCAFLLGSLYVSWVARKRFTYLAVKNNFEPIQSIGNLVNEQSTLFLCGIACLALFVAWFLVLTTAGKVTPYETD